MAFKTKLEKIAYSIGFKRGKNAKSGKKQLKTYSFQAFNSNCDIFNVDVKGYSKKDALRHAKKHLKRDPEHKGWDVNISDSKADKKSYYRTIYVHRDGKVTDNWKPYYKK